MGWMDKITKCSHQYQDLTVEGFRMQICSLCGSVQGWSDSQQRWLWCGSMQEQTRYMRHQQIMAEVKCRSSETVREDSLKV